MAAKKQTYEQAMKRLEEIVSRIDSNELDIDSLGVNLKEAQELIKFCREQYGYPSEQNILMTCWPIWNRHLIKFKSTKADFV